MTRHRIPPFAFTSVLLLGVVLGMLAERLARPLAADTPPAAALSKAATASASPTATPAPDIGAAALDPMLRQYALFEPVNRTFELVARTVAPCVVHITATKKRSVDRGSRHLVYEETGSGFITKAPGSPRLVVLTNHHVIENADPGSILIALHDGRLLQPAGVCSDKKADVAVLELDRTDLPAARLGDSDEAAVGSWVLAMGSPFGLKHSVSQGIISARGRHEDELHDEGVENQDFLQTDAAINPGNSGGPLVNLRGEVIGINTAIATNHGGSEGVGFSIPVNLVKWIINELVIEGRVRRGGMGVDLAQVPASLFAQIGLDRPRGAVISRVNPGSPAAQAGIKVGDVALKFNTIEVNDLNHLINLVSMTPIGQVVELTLWRDGKSRSAKVKVADLDVVRTKPVKPTGSTTSRGGAEGKKGPAPNPTPAPSAPGAGSTRRRP